MLDGLQHGERRGASQRVSAECRAVIALLQQVGGLAARQARANRESAAKALSHREHVRQDPVLLKSEPRSRSADAGLDLIEHEQRTELTRQLARLIEVRRGELVDAALALDGLE